MRAFFHARAYGKPAKTAQAAPVAERHLFQKWLLLCFVSFFLVFTLIYSHSTHASTLEINYIGEKTVLYFPDADNSVFNGDDLISFAAEPGKTINMSTRAEANTAAKQGSAIVLR